MGNMWIFVTFSVVVVLCLCYVSAANSGQKLGPQIVVKRGNLQSAALLDDTSNQSPCDPDSSCIPISGCPLLFDLIDQSCFGSDNQYSQSAAFRYFRRFNSLTCGHSGEEALVCCPPGGYNELLRPGETRLPPVECGETSIKGNYEGLGSQPWVARIGFSNKQTGRMRYPCSGSIVDKRVILTAAHCALAKAEGFKLTSVLAGEWDTEQTSDCNEMFCAPPTQNILVDHVVVHPGYEKKIFRHDIALIVLREDINYSLTSSPICVNDSPDRMSEPRGTLVGWGKLSGQAAQAPRQQQLSVPLVPLSRCEQVFGAIVPIHEGQLCAGGEEGKDACSGFGGSPLVMKIMGRFTQVGIVSFGSENCGSPGVPSVYTNVAHYANWIRENIPSETEN